MIVLPYGDLIMVLGDSDITTKVAPLTNRQHRLSKLPDRLKARHLYAVASLIACDRVSA